MPEGDTVWQAARRLHDALAGKVLTRSDLRVPRFATADLTGRTVLDVTPRGKHLLTRDRGRPDPPLPPADGRLLEGVRRTASAGRGGPAHQIRADPRHRGPHGRRLPPARPRTAAHHRRAPGRRPPRPRPPGPGLGPRDRPSPTSSPTPPAPSARPCSTSAISPASATSTRASSASCSASPPGSPSAHSPPTAPPSCPRSRRSSWRPTATARSATRPAAAARTCSSTAAPPAPVCAAAPRSASADQGDGSRERPTYWCPDCQTGPAPTRPPPARRPAPAPAPRSRTDRLTTRQKPSYRPSMAVRRTTSPDAPHSSPAPPAASAARPPSCSPRRAPPCTARTATRRDCTRRRP